MWFLEPLLGTRCCGLIPSVRFRSCLASRRTEWSLKASLKSLRFLSIFETFARDDRLCCARPRGRDLSNMLHSLERVLPTSEMPELVNELDSVLLKHPTCLQQNHAGNRKNNGGFFKAAMSQSCQRATNKLQTIGLQKPRALQPAAGCNARACRCAMYVRFIQWSTAPVPCTCPRLPHGCRPDGGRRHAHGAPPGRVRPREAA